MGDFGRVLLCPLETSARWFDLSCHSLASAQLLQRLLASAVEIQPKQALRAAAQHLVASHALRAADALQLAAALSWVELSGERSTVVTLDQRLRDAAQREGLATLP